jgi:hypothetical protein
VSATPPAGPPAKENTANRFSRQIDEAFEEASKLAGSSLAPSEFYEKFLTSALNAIDAPAGAVWLRTPQGFLQIAQQVNLDKVGLDAKRGGRQCHNEILRQVFQAQPSRPCMIEPQGRLSGMAEPGPVPAANLTEFYTLFAPIIQDDKAKPPLGLLEIFQQSNLDPRMYPTMLNYTVQMAGYASQYHQFSNVRQSAGLDKVFTQVEAFARLIHGTLNPTECAYHIANEGRRLVECDRLCVGVRHGKKAIVEAVSGADVVEKASTHVRRMKKLFNEVLKWGEKLVFKGTKDESLPPGVLHALDDYLAESQPKLLVVAPIRDEREKDDKKPAKSIMLLESFNPPENVEPMIQRLEIVGKHAAPALYNAAEMKSIPMRVLWWPVKKVQDGLGGKARLITFLSIAALVALTAIMVLVPYPLKMESKGQLEPVVIGQVFPVTDGAVRTLPYKPGDKVDSEAVVADMFSDELARKIREPKFALADAVAKYGALSQTPENRIPESDKWSWLLQMTQAKAAMDSQSDALHSMERLFNADIGTPGWYHAKAPKLDLSLVPANAKWTVLNSDNREQLLNRTVKPSEPILRLGYVEGTWHVMMKIPQRNIGHIMEAFDNPKYCRVEEKSGRKFLDVDLLVTSDSDTKRSGRLYMDDVAAEAVPNKDDHNESEPVVIAKVKINLDDFPEDRQVPRSLFVTGQEVHARIRCGERPMGYSLFHGVWEWFYEKVVFFF